MFQNKTEWICSEKLVILLKSDHTSLKPGHYFFLTINFY